MVHATMSAAVYRGRFAPSPTGPLHFGSLLAALASCLEARTRNGEWLVRIEDIDAPRCQPGADTEILRTLEAFGFSWDGEVMFQTQRTAHYQAALDRLSARGLTFDCACTRTELADSAIAVDGGQRYPGTCRHGLPQGKVARSVRLRVDDTPLTCDDIVQGRITQQLARDVGDFVLKRADGLFAYQLAVVVDDAWQGITDVVRGADLFASTPRQIYLQRCLGLPTPTYAHLPVAVNAAGEKLSKQTRAAPIDAANPAPILVAALEALGQMPPAGLAESSVVDVWAWAVQHWQLSQVSQSASVTAHK
jgi:glutamyl-Q tRNA(Asp) synthetase